MKIVTTITLPESLFARLKCAMRPGYGLNALAVYCLKRALQSRSAESFAPRATVLYNPEECSRKIHIWLTPEEHYSLKAWRLLTSTSVSYLAAQSIEKYLYRVISILLKRGGRALAWRQSLVESLRHIHRVVPFCWDRIFGMRLVLVRPGQGSG